MRGEKTPFIEDFCGKLLCVAGKNGEKRLIFEFLGSVLWCLYTLLETLLTGRCCLKLGSGGMGCEEQQQRPKRWIDAAGNGMQIASIDSSGRHGPSSI